jgi:hypothetical protein
VPVSSADEGRCEREREIIADFQLPIAHLNAIFQLAIGNSIDLAGQSATITSMFSPIAITRIIIIPANIGG